MAAPSGQIKPSRYFIPLALLLVVLYAVVLWPGHSAAPKLGLDLQGGTSLTLSANTVVGGKPVNSENLSIARSIIEQRVDSLGVADSAVIVQGHDIVVNVPGKVTDPNKLKQLSNQAKLEFRTVLKSVGDVSAAQIASQISPSASVSPSGSAEPKPSTSASAPAVTSSQSPAGDARLAAAPSTSPSVAPSATPTAVSPVIATPSAAPTSSESAAPAVAATGEGITPLADVKKKIGDAVYTAAAAVTDPSTITSAAQLAEFAPFSKLTPADVAALPPTMQYAIPQISCATLDQRVPGVITTDASLKSQVVSCGNQGGTEYKFLLDSAAVHGEDVSSASSAFDAGGNGSPALGWVVNLSFKGNGQKEWSNLTAQLYQDYVNSGNQTYRQVAIVLDNVVVTAPNIQAAIPGPATISGTFDASSAKLLSTQLKFGALPISFTAQDVNSVSATLGLKQLRAGLLAGAIGLVLVILYCLFYYRGLGLVVIASLLVSASIVYASIVLLGRSQLDFALSLSGVAGFIVAIGITADSFVVFFERLKDEVRDGRSGRSAVPKAWVRARRTILSADAVSLIAAIVLVIVATGPVSGFAFTLGLSTVIDLVVVFLFTHPLVSVLSGSKAFTSPRFSGLGDMRSARRSDPVAPTRVGAMRTKES